MWISNLILRTILWTSYCYSHFTEKEIDIQVNLPMLIQWIVAHSRFKCQLFMNLEGFCFVYPCCNDFYGYSEKASKKQRVTTSNNKIFFYLFIQQIVVEHLSCIRPFTRYGNKGMNGMDMNSGLMMPVIFWRKEI